MYKMLIDADEPELCSLSAELLTTGLFKNCLPSRTSIVWCPAAPPQATAHLLATWAINSFHIDLLCGSIAEKQAMLESTCTAFIVDWSMEWKSMVVGLAFAATFHGIVQLQPPVFADSFIARVRHLFVIFVVMSEISVMDDMSMHVAATVSKASGVKEEAPDDEGGASRKVSLKVNHAATATYEKYVPCG